MRCGRGRERVRAVQRQRDERRQKPFTVTDRRHFTTEGGVRQEPEAPTVTPAPAPDRPPAAGPPPSPDHAYPSDLPGLLLSLGTQASFLLLGGPEAPPDLEGARALISLLETLQRKTEGHRTDEEDGLLEGLLYELRMAFVARSKVAGA